MTGVGVRSAALGVVRRLGATGLGVLAVGHVVSPLQRRLYRFTGGRVSLTGRAPVLLLTTTGGGERSVFVLEPTLRTGGTAARDHDEAGGGLPG
jgi:hypothetical protein